MTGWIASAWNAPMYYDYGTNCYYDDGRVYYNEQPIATEQEWAQQAQDIATSVPEVNPDDVQWLPLGVFALTQDGEASGAEPTLFLQLAVSKEAIIAGTFRNSATESVTEVEGMVDRRSQRAAWGPVGKKWPIMETGINNLTKDDASALLHFENGQTQQWLMVRLEEPKDAAGD